MSLEALQRLIRRVAGCLQRAALRSALEDAERGHLPVGGVDVPDAAGLQAHFQQPLQVRHQSLRHLARFHRRPQLRVHLPRRRVPKLLRHRVDFPEQNLPLVLQQPHVASLQGFRRSGVQAFGAKATRPSLTLPDLNARMPERLNA